MVEHFIIHRLSCRQKTPITPYTPNTPNGLFEKIVKEPEASCIYNRLKMNYTYGLDRIYSRQEIEKAKNSPSFGREYDLQYLGLIGNTFHTGDIERAIALGKKYRTNSHTKRWA